MSSVAIASPHLNSTDNAELSNAEISST